MKTVVDLTYPELLSKLQATKDTAHEQWASENCREVDIWFGEDRNDFTQDQLLSELMPLIQNGKNNIDVLLLWRWIKKSKQNVGFDRLMFVVANMHDEGDMKDLMRSWYGEADSKFDIETLIALTLHFKQLDMNVFDMFEQWMKNKQNGIGIESLVKLLDKMGEVSDFRKVNLFDLWYEKPENKMVDKDVILLMTMIENAKDKHDLFLFWLMKKENNPDEAQFIQLMKAAKIDTDQTYTISQKLIFKKWSDKSEKNKKSLVNVILVIKDQNRQFTLLDDFLKSEYIRPTSHEMKAILVSLKETFLKIRQGELIGRWVCQNKDKKLELAEYLNVVLSVEPDSASLINLLDHYFDVIGHDKMVESDVDSVLRVMDTFEDIEYKATLFQGLIQKFQVCFNNEKGEVDKKKKMAFFLAVLMRDQSPLKYEVFMVRSMFNLLKFETTQWIDVSIGLYPGSELAQAELFYDLIKDRSIPQDTFNEMRFAFLNQLKDDNVFHDVIVRLKESGKGLPDKQVLQMIQGRVISQYESLAALLDKPLDQVLTPAGLERVRNELFEGSIPDNIRLSALVLFFDMKDQMNILHDWIQPSVFEDIKNNFRPSAKTPYLTSAEHEKLFQLGLDPLPSMGKLCDALKIRMPSVQSINTSKEELAKLNTATSSALLTLLENNNRTDKDVVDFFESVLNGDVKVESEKIKIKDKEKVMLKDFFDANSAEIAYMFSLPEGLSSFVGLLGTLSHGCVANIGTQAKLALYQFLLQRIELPSLEVSLKALHERQGMHIHELSQYFAHKYRFNPSLDDKKIFTTFFNVNQPFFVYVLLQQDGVTRLEVLLNRQPAGSLEARLERAMNQFLLHDSLALIMLFTVFRDSIFVPFVNRYSGDALGASSRGLEVFDDFGVRSCFISPTGLVAAIASEYYDQNKARNAPWDCINSLLEEDQGLDLMEKMMKMYPDTDKFNQASAYVASYLILRATAPELLENKFLDEFRNEYEALCRVESTSTAMPLLLSQSTAAGPSGSNKPSLM